MTLLGMAVLLGCSAFFSGTETALFSLTREKIKALKAENHNLEKMLALLTDNPSGLLVAILFGNLVVNILFFSMSAVLSLHIGELYGDWWQAAMGVVVLLLVILTGEIMPKAIGMSYPERVVRLNSLPLCYWFHFLGPVRIVLEKITRRMEPAGDHDHQINSNELKMLVEVAQHDPSFGTQEKAIVEDIVSLPEMRVRELMVPRVKQFFRRADSPAGEAMTEAAEQEVELIPVYDGDEDNIVGVVEVRDLFVDGNADRPVGIFAHPVKFVPETKRADEMLREFLSEGWRMVCVVNEYGGLAGTICLEDLLEEVVGEFDAHESAEVEQLGENIYRLQGSLGIREWRHLFIGFVPDAVMRDMALDTISGLVVSLLKRLPVPGDVAQIGNLRFTVEQVRSNRIESVLLELNSKGAGE
jgi:CBS domain containing-hemolysin-like protein